MLSFLTPEVKLLLTPPRIFVEGSSKSMLTKVIFAAIAL